MNTEPQWIVFNVETLVIRHQRFFLEKDAKKYARRITRLNNYNIDHYEVECLHGITEKQWKSWKLLSK